MATIKKSILHITPFFSPNIGGVETHLNDLVKILDKHHYSNTILTYSPITNPNTKYKNQQKICQRSFVRRFSWIGYNLFHILEKKPIVNFLYISPYLLIRSSLWLLLHPHKHFDIIHSHGINAALIGQIIKKIFNIKSHVVSIYSTYDNVPINSKQNKQIKAILSKADSILVQSQQSFNQFKKMGLNNLSQYRHWIDLKQFCPPSKPPKNFTVLFVGRMIPQKGAYLLAKIASSLPQIKFIFVGTGPDYQKIKKLKLNNLKLVGNISYHKLHLYYQKTSLLCIPSLYQEGWGRVAMEALSSGLPVIASNKGGLVEFLNPSIAIISPPKPKNIKSSILKLYKNKKLYRKLQKNCRPYAKQNFSSKNIKLITQVY